MSESEFEKPAVSCEIWVANAATEVVEIRIPQSEFRNLKSIA